MLSNLNGWQRLWVLLTGLWLIAAAILTAQGFPTEAKSRAQWKEHTAWVLKDYEDRMKEIKDHCANSSRSDDVVKSFGKYKDCWEANKPQYENASTQRREQMTSLYGEGERRISEDLPKHQVVTVIKGFALWIVPALLLYALGMGADWVRRGFRNGV